MNQTTRNQMNMRLIRNTDQQTADLVTKLYNKEIISDFTDDGWVLNKGEWYPVNVFMEVKKHEYL
jgi:hypothetical protein